MSSFCFQPHILQPTRTTDHSGKITDNIFFNSLKHFTISSNVIYGISHHLPNFLIYDNFSSLSMSSYIKEIIRTSIDIIF